MSKRYYDDWLQTFVQYASYGEAPLKMLFWTGVSTVAGALRRRVWIDQKYFQWLSNFYIIFVAPPGIVSKTTTANIGMNLLRGLPQGTIKFGADSVTWQSMITSLAESAESVADPFHLGDFYPMSAVTFCSDELGNLLKPADDSLISSLITLWDGKQGAFKKDTKSQGKDNIENPWVNIIGCTTPSWIGQNVPEVMVGGGFTSRCVFVYADQKRQFVPYPDEVTPPDFGEIAKKLIHDLEMISLMFGEFKISEEARVFGRSWYKHHWENRPKHLTGEQFSGYMARKQTHLHKLCMIVSASQNDSMIITKPHMEMALMLISEIEKDMPRVFSRIGQNDITRGSAEIVDIVTGHPGIPQSVLYGEHLFRTMSYTDFISALSGCVNGHKVHSRQVGNSVNYYPGPTS